METETGSEFISEAHVRHILRYVNACKYLKGGLVLDAACGTGYGTKILAPHCANVIGIDFSQDAIKEAVKDYIPQCQFMQANLLEANYGGVDTIISIETIEHFSKDDGTKLLKNFHKWLHRKGELIITTPYCLQSGPSPITKQHLWEYSLTDIERAIAEVGFEVEIIDLKKRLGKAGRLGDCMIKAVKP